MQLSLEIKALGWALLMGGLSLGATGLVAASIQREMGSGGVQMAALSDPLASGGTPEMVKQGQEYFGLSCSQCHGDDAHGDEGPDLHNLSISNARIANTIKRGVKGEMPTFAKKYDDQQVAALVSYLRTLR